MGKIVLLDDITINQIAAGEVIERPASVVKELMENSIDAGATEVTVEIQNGGIKKIKIIDNGSGIKEDDLDFAFERHATSKIRAAKDLEQVKSMGFRGEALASIAAIAHVEMVTKTEDEMIGHKIIIEGGNILEKEEAGSKTGTTITVSNLFYNTPVRYKFLKKDFTESGYIEDAVTRIALSNPGVAIKLINENKTIVQTPGNGDLKTVIYGLYGKDIVDNIVEANYEFDDIKISGFVGKPAIARGNRTYQMFFVNKRFIKDKTLTSAVEQAFKGLLPIGKYGFVILNLDVEPNKIDVNVHPTKLEIRFSEEQKIFKAVFYAIKEALLKSDLTRDNEEEIVESKMIPQKVETLAVIEKNEDDLNLAKTNAEKPLKQKDKFILKQEEKEKSIVEHQQGFFSRFRKKEEEFIEKQTDNAIEQIFNRVGVDDTRPLVEEHENKEEPIVSSNLEAKVVEEPKNFEKMYSKTFGVTPKKETKMENISLFEDSEEYKEIKKYKYIGTIFATYLVIEIENEVYIIDQHAAHERIKYEQIKKNFYSENGKDSQMMLLPDIINLTHKERCIVKENEDLFKRAGFIIEDFGENTIRLLGVPTICMDLDTKELFLNILDAIGSVAITAVQEKEEKFVATVACKAAVKANSELTKEEVENLMTELLKLPNPFTCPHGRPTAIKMTKTEIEKKFDRR